MVTKPNSKTKLAALADIHMHDVVYDDLRNLFSQIPTDADILLLCGDLTHHGLIEEAELLLQSLDVVTIPIVAVLGNHDYDKGQEKEIADILRKKVHVPDGEFVVIENIGFAGVKGFAGGFGIHMSSEFGETAFKQFVKESIDEEVKLERLWVKLI